MGETLSPWGETLSLWGDHHHGADPITMWGETLSPWGVDPITMGGDPITMRETLKCERKTLECWERPWNVRKRPILTVTLEYVGGSAPNWVSDSFLVSTYHDWVNVGPWADTQRFQYDKAPRM